MDRLSEVAFAASGVGLLSWLCWSDLNSRSLGNRPVVAYLVLFAAYALMKHPLWGLGHLVVASLAFVILLLLFLVNAMGGGDVKLGSVVFLWAGPENALPVIVVVAWSGGIIAVLGWLVDREWYRRNAGQLAKCVGWALSAQRGVPYGVALSLGGAYVVWQQLLRGA